MPRSISIFAALMLLSKVPAFLVICFVDCCGGAVDTDLDGGDEMFSQLVGFLLIDVVCVCVKIEKKTPCSSA